MFDGLPGEVEYDIDLSDQGRPEENKDGPTEESVGYRARVTYSWVVIIRF